MLDHVVKRGKKTAWLNELAKMKGVALTDEQLLNADELMEELLDWVLIDYIDAQEVTSALKCECGRSLRYQYIVKHKSTGVIYKFGKEHFKQHTGLDDQTVIAVIRGLEKIDLERDEILSKVKDQIRFSLHPDIVIPEDIQQQLDVNLPLLDCQYHKLMKQYEKQMKASQVVVEPQVKLKDQVKQLSVEELLNELKSDHLKISTVQRLQALVDRRSEELVSHGVTRDLLIQIVNQAIQRTRKVILKAALDNLMNSCKRY